MHCPFCVKTETYPDPVILRAHYRVKHVDKGLDFAGEHLTSSLYSLGIRVQLILEFPKYFASHIIHLILIISYSS